jgi:hypothetical protein
MFENYSNIYKDSNKYANYGISQQEKKYLKKAKQQNKQNKYGLSSFSNSTINNHIGGLDSNIEAFGGMNQTQFLERFQNQQPGQTTQTMQSPQTLSGMNFGSSPPNPYPTNPSNSQNVSIQQINNQIQSLNNQNKLQAYNPKNPSNNVTTYSNQSEAVISQNQLTDAEIAELVGLTIQYNQLINQYNNAQTSVMNNADNQVLSMNSTTNPYLGQNLEISGGQVYYITNAGIAQPYEISPTQVQNDPWLSEMSAYYSPLTNTPTNVNSTSAINATAYDSGGTSYINTTPAMQIGNPKYQWSSSGNEGTNVYANNSQPLSFTDSSYVGCYNTTISNGQQPLMSLAPGSSNNNYTFQACQQVAYDSGSPFFSFNVSSPTSQTGTCYLSNSQANINTMTTQCPAVNYTYTKLWSTNITPVSGSDMSSNYMSLDPAGNVVIYNSSNIAIWSSDNSNNALSVSNYVGCYQSSITSPVTSDVTSKVQIYNQKPVCTDRYWWGGCKPGNNYPTGTYPIPNDFNYVTNPVTTNVTVPTMQDVTNSSNNTWETCYQYAYNGNYNYFGVSNFNPANGTSNCLVSRVQNGGGVPNSCSLEDQLYYGGNGSNAVYSVSGEPLNAFLTLQDNGMVTAFTGTTLQDQQNITWQLDMSGQTQMSNCQVYTDANYPVYMQTGQWLYEGGILSSPNGMVWLTMQGGNLVLYTSSNTPKCYGMTTQNNQTYYAGDISMNALYQSTNTTYNQTEYLGNIGYVDGNSILYQYPQNLVGQGNTFTYMGNYDSSGTPITNTSNGSIYFAGLDLSGAMQQCIDLSCNAFIMLSTNNGNVLTKFMQTAFATPTYGQSSSNYLPRFPNPNAQFYLRNPTVNNSPYCNKSITGINTGLTSNYQTNGQMNTNMQCVQITTTDPQLKALGQQINNLSGKISTMQNNLMNKTMTVTQQQQLNEIVLGRQFKEIDTVEAVQKQSKQNAINAQNIKNDSNIVVLRENQSYTLWSVLAITIALISIHVIR